MAEVDLFAICLQQQSSQMIAKLSGAVASRFNWAIAAHGSSLKIDIADLESGC
ncbi:MAG TPA: hypothetical protein VFO40_24600 [Chthoniobacterales bacterium]|nr:hypothetical protein [Chthoniobacterales bacterium]